MLPLRSFCSSTTSKKLEKKQEMVSTSFRHFVLAIMVLLLATKACEANSDEGFKKVEAEAGNGIMPPGGKEMHNAKEIYNAGPRVAADTSGKFGGRKMMLEIKGLSNEVKKEESKKTSEEASKISGASSVGNSKHTWKGKLNMQSKLSSRSVNHHLKVNMGGFMALNADYHMAKTHPPRNN